MMGALVGSVSLTAGHYSFLGKKCNGSPAVLEIMGLDAELRDGMRFSTLNIGEHWCTPRPSDTALPRCVQKKASRSTRISRF